MSIAYRFWEPNSYPTKTSGEVSNLLFIGWVDDTKSPGAQRYQAHWRCYCGEEFIARAQNVCSGHTSSCGCYCRKKMSEIGSSIRGEAHPAWKGGISKQSYRHAHTLKYKQMGGPAKNFPCTSEVDEFGCGAITPGNEYALQPFTPLEAIQFDDRGHFSLDPAHYEPMCRPCHQRMDNRYPPSELWPTAIN